VNYELDYSAEKLAYFAGVYSLYKLLLCASPSCRICAVKM